MKICFLLHEGSMYSGGQGVYLANLSRELSALGNEVHVIAGPPYPELDADVVLHKVKNYNYHRLLATGRRFFYGRPVLDAFHPLNIGELVTTRLGMFSVMGAFSIRAYEQVRALLPQHRFDVVHDNQVLGYGTLLIKLLGLPVVATIHHPLMIDRANRVREARSAADQVRAVLFYPFFMQEIVARRIDRVVTVSASSAHAIARTFGLPEERVAVVWNGVDGQVFRRLASFEPESGRILFVGDSDDRNKGFEHLLGALARLSASHKFKLVVVQRAWSSKAPALASEYGLAGRITFLDSLSRDGLVEEYNRAQILVSPSLYEGFGLPAAEAMACGTPVIATTAGALPEIVEDGATGVTVPPGDDASLAHAIALLLDDPARCRSMGAAGIRRATDRFSWRSAAVEMLSLYSNVIDSQRRSRSDTMAPLVESAR